MIKNNKSNLSLAINSTMFAYKYEKPLLKKSMQGEFTIKIANTLEERAAAFRLGYQVYLSKGYVNKNPNEWLIRNFDSNSETIILIVQDKQKNIAGSATLVFDGDSMLPAEKVYGDELKVLKRSGNRTAELCRLVIDPNFRNSKDILVLLFNYAAIYIHHVKKYDGLAVEVTPRHKNYYKTLLSFDEIGDAKPNPYVENTVGVLLYLPTKKYHSEVRRCRNPQSTEEKERSLFPYFLKTEQENLVAHYLKKQVNPMTTDEKIYFGFSESSLGKTICV